MRKKSWGIIKKSFLDKIIEKVRFLAIPKAGKRGRILDLGCGYNAELLKRLEGQIDSGIGIDLSVNKKLNSKKIQLITSPVDTKINLPSNSFDAILSLAVIEHLKKPDVMLKEALRMLKPHGLLFLTTPSDLSKPILEFFAYKLKLISREEISDHRRYYSKESVLRELMGAGFEKKNIRIRTFLGMNLFVEATK